jgi:hypothetical protein
MNDDNVVDLAGERGKRIHDQHEKRLLEVREAFAQALPLGKVKGKAKNKPKKC